MCGFGAFLVILLRRLAGRSNALKSITLWTLLSNCGDKLLNLVFRVSLQFEGEWSGPSVLGVYGGVKSNLVKSIDIGGG